MIESHIVAGIKKKFPHDPTGDQEKALQVLAEFLNDRSPDAAFLLRGYAGTGKSSLVAALVRWMDELHQPVVLMAPTGRAAKQFSLYAHHPAFTIHKRIYRQKVFDGTSGNFTQNVNLARHTLYLVDEASMIANQGLAGGAFGTGRLLDDLIHFVYSGQGCRLVLTGDTAQLPPVGEEESPALVPEILKGYGLQLFETELRQVVRQAETSGILWNATALRKCLSEELYGKLPKIKVSGFPDVVKLSGEDLIETISRCYQQAGEDETMVVTRSNKRAVLYNKGIRSTILYREDELNSGDKLMIARNNYFWVTGEKQLDFLANGDQAIVRRVRRSRELHGFRFADVTLSFPDYEDLELEMTVLLDTLHCESPSLSREESERLFQNVWEDYTDLPTKPERIKKIKQDPYYNALQVKYGYAVTCHKAQGGQWAKVFLDQGYISEEQLTPDYFRWLYTAFTRATETLYLVNYPQEQTL